MKIVGSRILRFIKLVPRLTLALYAVAAAVGIIDVLINDSMRWFFVLQALALPTSLVFDLLPIPGELPRSLDLGLFMTTLVINGAILYLLLCGLAKLVESLWKRRSTKE